MMTVAELIEKLSKIDPTYKVLDTVTGDEKDILDVIAFHDERVVYV